MTGTLGKLRLLVRHLLAFTGWRAVAVVALMVIAAMTEGLGLILLVPLMAVVGLGAGEPAPGGFLDSITRFIAGIGIPMNLNTLLAVFLLIVIIRQTVVYLSARMVEDTRIGYMVALRRELFSALCETSWRTVKGGNLAQFGHVVLVDSWRAADAAQGIFQILSSSALVLASFTVAVILSPLLAVLVLVSIALLILIFSNRYAAVRGQGDRVVTMQNELYRVVENYLDNLRVAKLANAENRMQEEFSGTVSNLGDEYSGFTGNMARTRVALQISSAIGVGAFLLIAVNVFGSRGPELLLLVLITARLVPQCSVLNQYVHHLLHNLPAFSAVIKALDDCRDTPDAPESGSNDVVPERSIELRNVAVSGSGASGTQLLNEVSLEIEAGEFVVIQGPSGAGKSTLADVISGLLPVESGEMCIDGKALSLLELRAWRRSVGYVPQHSAMLRDTVLQNLSWVLRAPPGAADVQRALRCADAERIVEALPEGLHTMLSRREDRLSGGERQRLSLARELLRRPRLLILDEAMNALDPETESRVLRNLRAWRPELTVVIISHRKGSEAFADRVIMLGSGRIISNTKQTTTGGGSSRHA